MACSVLVQRAIRDSFSEVVIKRAGGGLIYLGADVVAIDVDP